MSLPHAPSPGPAARRAYDYAKWAILNAVYGPGDVVTEGGLAAEVGVSRGTARDAVLRLTVEGLLSPRPGGRGSVVSRFSRQEAEDVLEARILVENHTAARSFARRTTLLPELEVVHAEMVQRHEEHDTARFTDADRRFHEAIVDAAGNAVLSSIYRMLRERQTLFTSVLMRGRGDRMAAALDEHEKVLAALRGDDAEAFARVVDEHLRWSVELVRASQ